LFGKENNSSTFSLYLRNVGSRNSTEGEELARCTVTLSPSPNIRVRAPLVNCVLELQFWCPKYDFGEEGSYSSTSRKHNPYVQTVLSPWCLVFQQILLVTSWSFRLVKHPIVSKTPESLHSSHNFMSISRTEIFLGMGAGNTGSAK
jgi:hypothetical protein